jgi:hypothetical protein
MITDAKFEARAEWELDKGATELKPLVSLGRAIAQPFAEEEWEPVKHGSSSVVIIYGAFLLRGRSFGAPGRVKLRL